MEQDFYIAFVRSIRIAILVREYPYPLRILAIPKVNIAVRGCIIWVAVTDFQVTRGLIAAIDELMGVLGTGRKSSAHSGREQLLASIGA